MSGLVIAAARRAIASGARPRGELELKSLEERTTELRQVNEFCVLRSAERNSGGRGGCALPSSRASTVEGDWRRAGLSRVVWWRGSLVIVPARK